MFHPRKLTLLVALLILMLPTIAIASEPDVTVIAHNLNNPRGIAIRPDNSLLLVEAGDGTSEPETGIGTGRILHLVDRNSDGDFDDENERTALLSNEPSYNALALFPAFHDEVFGLGDLILFENGQVFFTKDDPLYQEEILQGTDPISYYLSNTGIFELNSDGTTSRNIKFTSTVNSIVYDTERDLLFFTASGANRILSMPLEGSEEPIHTVDFPFLEDGQQAVPAGLALDPTNGDILIALLSGFLFDYYGTTISYLPNSARIMRYNPNTGELTDEIRNLTTAIDVAVDEDGNVYVVELTRGWSPTLMPVDFDLFDADAPPDPGGYVRWDGRVTMYPKDGSDARILLDDIDTPTNVTYANDRLYISAGLGTPGRSVISADGIKPIEGVVYMISNFK